ncbi:MAG: phospholipase D-like domain-containing protein [Oleiphilaceae bacterium]|nr:phospholipase D-like domain-containing protein [Oleiphilaceae bacterium]
MSWLEGGLMAALVGVLHFSAALATSGHAILSKRDSRAAVAWVGVIWLVPFAGPVLYLLLGINRIRRRAAELRREKPRVNGGETLERFTPPPEQRNLPAGAAALARLVDRVTLQPLLEGNRIRPLKNGDQAYPAMLEAINSARESITLSTYLFANDATGRDFARALGQAVRRGVAVRVLVDAVGMRYSFPTIARHLHRERVPFARFLPTRTPLAMPFMNLRNHRKLLVVDGLVGFTGGMNIAEGNRLTHQPRRPIRDLHFALEGPVVTQLQAVFAEDWAFTTREYLTGPQWFPAPYAPGNSLARVVVDGPDESFDTLRQILVGALSVAEKRVSIMTPYFLPDATLQDALQTAALRGVSVDVLLPERNNLKIVDWACRPHLEELVRWGVRVWYSRGDFDHSKVMTVDGCWALLGSANWDPRSLSLNFECNVECHDARVCAELEAWFDIRLYDSFPLSEEQLRSQWLITRLRNGMARLLSPYL